MIDRITDEESIAREQRRDIERRTNKAVGLASLSFASINIVTQLLQRIDYSQNVSDANLYIFLPLSVLVVVFYLVAYFNDFDGPWVKIMLTSGIILMNVGHFFIFTIYAAYFVLVPLIISTRYFDRRFIAHVAAVTGLLFAIACVLNIVMCDRWNLLSLAHISNVFDPWQRPIDALVYVIVPLSLTCVFVAVYSIEMSRSGGRLLNIQARTACRVAAVDTELQMAADIQRGALSAEAFTVPGGNFKLQAKEVPAREVGGDFYDYGMVNSNTLAVLIADVSDKGVPAAMFMMSAKKALSCAAECCKSLEEAAELANRLICKDNDSDMFLTLWLGVINIETGIGKYINAGHPFPLIKSADGKLRWIENKPDMFLGVFRDKVPAVNTFKMEPGDTLLLFTDGITDALNGSGERFGLKGIEQAIAGSMDAETAVQQVIGQSTAFARDQQQFDDMTLLALQCVNTLPPETVQIETLAGPEGTEQIIDGINSLLEKCKCPEQTRQNAGVVVDEICANIYDYAYDGAPGPLAVTAEAGSNYLRLTFTDKGPEFNPLYHADPELENMPALGGLGIFFVKNLTDTLDYCRSDDCNMLTAEIIWGM